MAGDWIKVEDVTPDKPEIFLMADYLKIDPDAVLGKLIRVWTWADQQTVDGHATRVTISLLDRVAGEPHFTAAMESVGWLIKTEDGIELPNFDRHNGETAKARALAAKRQAKRRTKSHANSHADVTEGALPREEKRREDIELPKGNSNSGSGTKKPRKLVKDNPPTLDEVRDYCQQRGNSVDAKAFLDYYETAEWCDGDGKLVRNWKQKIIGVWEPMAKRGQKPKPFSGVTSWYEKKSQEEGDED